MARGHNKKMCSVITNQY